MPNPAVSQSVNPSDPTTKASGRPARQDDLNIQINEMLKRLDRIESALASSAWQPFKFTAAWTNYDTGGAWGPCGYLIDGTGFVHTRGLVKNTVGVNYSTGANEQIATGFPQPEQYVMGIGVYADSGGHFGVARVDMSAGGILYMAGNDFASTGGNSGLYAWMAIILPSYKSTSA